MQRPRTVPAYILAGGQSRRFGSDKARALVDGLPMISRIARSLAPAASSITVVAAASDQYADLGLRTIPDLHPGRGPMAGLQAALRDPIQPKWILLVSCDLVTVRPQWLSALLSGMRDGSPIVAFRHDFWEPLFALYHATIADEVDRRLAAGQLTMQRLLHAVPCVALPLPIDWRPDCHINTQAELDAYLAARQTMETAMPENKDSAKLPGTYRMFVSKYPALGAAHESIAKAVDAAGPLDRKTCELIKIGLAVGAGLETATRSHVRRALEHGATEAEIEQAMLLAYNTCGFPRMVMAWQWARQQIEREQSEEPQKQRR